MADRGKGSPADTGRDEETGQFLPGNRLWEVRSTAGPKPKFKDGEQLWASCVEYFEWVTDNPLLEGIAYQGKVSPDGLPKMRAMTLTGLCLFIDVTRETWTEWRTSRPDLSDVITRAEAVIYSQKFEGAAAGLLNANIIARDLGLAEKNEHTGKDGGPMEMVTHDADEFASRITRLAAAKADQGGTGETEAGDEG